MNDGWFYVKKITRYVRIYYETGIDFSVSKPKLKFDKLFS